MCVCEEFSSLFAFSPFLPLPSFLPHPLSSFFQTGFHVAKTVFQLLILLPPLPPFTTTPNLCYSGGGTQDFTRLAWSLYPLSHILSPGKIPCPANSVWGGGEERWCQNLNSGPCACLAKALPQSYIFNPVLFLMTIHRRMIVVMIASLPHLPVPKCPFVVSLSLNLQLLPVTPLWPYCFASTRRSQNHTGCPWNSSM